MKAEPSPESFDCVRFMREARARTYEATKHMSTGEFVQWLNRRRPTDPVLAELWDRSQEPTGRRKPVPTPVDR